MILKWDEDRAKPNKHRKFDSLWSGPYITVWEIQMNAYELECMKSQILSITMNEQHLKYDSET